MTEALVTARGITKRYRSGPKTLTVLEALDFDLAAGDSVAVVGDSGVGKSTLLHLLGALDRPDAGELTIGGLELTAASGADRRRYRNGQVGFIFQFHHLLPELTALENVELPLTIARAGESEAPARALLERLGLGERLGHLPSQLSGGEQQRVAIARAIVAEPSLVLADEPTGNLDPATGRAVLELLTGLQQERGFALLIVTHSERLARACRQVLRLENGRLRALGADEIRDYFAGLGAGATRDPML